MPTILAWRKNDQRLAKKELRCRGPRVFKLAQHSLKVDPV